MIHPNLPEPSINHKQLNSDLRFCTLVAICVVLALAWVIGH